MRVGYDRYSLRIAGERRLIRSASLEYFRLPSQWLWKDRIEKIRVAGFNAVSVAYPWSYHSSAPHQYDWTGLRDVDALHDMIEEAGLFLIGRPGPYIGADLDSGGLPRWLIGTGAVPPRGRSWRALDDSPEFMLAALEWYEEVARRFIGRSNLILVEVEHQLEARPPLRFARSDAAHWAVRWLGARTALRLMAWAGRLPIPWPGGSTPPAQAERYVHELRRVLQQLGLEVPTFHADLDAPGERQLDVEIPAFDPRSLLDLGLFEDTLSKRLAELRGLEARIDRLGRSAPVFHAGVPAGGADQWGGAGYERIRRERERLPLNTLLMASLAERATLVNVSHFAGGTTWGYMGTPGVYTSYDCGAPIAESGVTDGSYDDVRRLQAWLERYQADLCETDRDEAPAWGPAHLASRKSERRLFAFLCNDGKGSVRVRLPEGDELELQAGQAQIRAYTASGSFESATELGSEPQPSPPELPPALPRLESWTLSTTSAHLDPAFDDGDWPEISRRDLERRRIDMDALGLHYGFVWYRGAFVGVLDRLLIDARHCYSVWLNRQLIAMGDQLRNPFGVGPDAAAVRAIPTRDLPVNEGRNALVILVESLGHDEGFADEWAQPRGLAYLDTGATPVRWRYRGGLVRGERGIAPVVVFEGVERVGTEEVALPHGWSGDPEGVVLYETQFRLDGVDPKSVQLALRLDPGRGKANLYVNGCLIGRYWPERGPQRDFPVPWGLLQPDQENHLAVALWKRSERAALGRVRLVTT